jgi:hypothetical protein
MGLYVLSAIASSVLFAWLLIIPVRVRQCRTANRCMFAIAQTLGHKASLMPSQPSTEPGKTMNPSNTPPSDETPVDADLARQAHPGHGIPSQDPTGAAQSLLKPHEAEREAKSALVGGGLVAGATAGVAVGLAVAGPVGIVPGAAVGAVAGVVGGATAGAAVSPENPTPVDTTHKDTLPPSKDE